MPTRRTDPSDAPSGFKLKAAVSVSEMARSLRLSRARFYELVDAGVMPPPVYLVRTRRPFYTAELQAVCMRVRESGEGLNREPVVFYAARGKATAQKPTRSSRNGSKAPKPDQKLQPIMDGLKQLGVSDPDPSAVEAIVAELYPNGVCTETPESVLTAVFRSLNRRN